MTETKKQRVRASITVEFDIVDPTALRAQQMTENSDGELIVWNHSTEETALHVLTDLATEAWSEAADRVGLGHGFGLQARVIELHSDDA